MTDRPIDDSGDAPNEILAAAKEHKAVVGKPAPRQSWPLAKIGLAAGIGSAAVAAAVLFAGRRSDDK